MPRIFRDNVAAEHYWQNLTTPRVTGYPFSMMAWGYLTAADPASNDYCLMQLQDKDVGNQYVRLGTGDSDGIGGPGKFRTLLSETTTIGVVGTTTVVANRWYHVAAVFRSTTYRALYINGILEGSTTTTKAMATGIDSVSIGWEGDSSPGDAWVGYIAAPALFARELRPSELFAIGARGSSPLLYRPAHYWPMIGTVGTTEQDMIGPPYPLTMVGTPPSDTLSIAPIHPPMQYFPPHATFRPMVEPPAAPAGSVRRWLTGWTGGMRDMVGGTRG